MASSKKFTLAALLTACMLLSSGSWCSATFIEDDITCSFSVPEGWSQAMSSDLPPQVAILVKSPLPNTLPPSINLATEKVSVSLSQYLKTVKELWSATGDSDWKDLGDVETAAGTARLTLIDTVCKWGPTKLIQAIMVKDGIAYVLTASSLKGDFSDHYKTFFTTIKSFDLKRNT